MPELSFGIFQPTLIVQLLQCALREPNDFIVWHLSPVPFPWCKPPHNVGNLMELKPAKIRRFTSHSPMHACAEMSFSKVSQCDLFYPQTAPGQDIMTKSPTRAPSVTQNPGSPCPRYPAWCGSPATHLGREACRHISHTFQASSHASHRSCASLPPSARKWAPQTLPDASSTTSCAQKASSCNPFGMF